MHLPGSAATLMTQLEKAQNNVTEGRRIVAEQRAKVAEIKARGGNARGAEEDLLPLKTRWRSSRITFTPLKVRNRLIHPVHRSLSTVYEARVAPDSTDYSSGSLLLVEVAF